MVTTAHPRQFEPELERQERHAAGVTASGSMLETLGGVAVAVLAVLALVGIAPALLIAIAGIVFGAAMLVEGLSVASEYRTLAAQVADGRAEIAEFGGGLGVEVLVGLATIALGILSLLAIDASTLLPVLIITGGVGLMLSAGTTQRLNDLTLTWAGHGEMTRRFTHEAMAGAAIAQTLGGLAAVVLGILALVDLDPMAAAGFGTLPQVGMLVLGVATAMSGGAIAGKATRLYRHA